MILPASVGATASTEVLKLSIPVFAHPLLITENSCHRRYGLSVAKCTESRLSFLCGQQIWDLNREKKKVVSQIRRLDLQKAAKREKRILQRNLSCKGKEEVLNEKTEVGNTVSAMCLWSEEEKCNHLEIQ